VLKERNQKVVLQATEPIYSLAVSLLIQNNPVENEDINTGVHQGTNVEGKHTSVLF